MERIENKARYYFGDKPVIEKAADEDEFEGAVFEQNVINAEEIEENILALNLPDFWNQIWIQLIQLDCTVEISDNYQNIILKDVSAQDKYPYGKSIEQIFYENVSGAHKRGWNWSGDTDIYVKQLNLPKNLAEAVISWLIAKRCSDGLPVWMYRNCMQVEPNSESAYNSWTQFFDDAFNHCEHNLTKFKGKPLRDLVLSNDGNTKIAMAQQTDTTYIIVEYMTS